jgi:DHA3 family macrolide efflux protein-like MFS transporter
VSGRNWKKDISIFLGSQTLSLFGSMLVQYAIMWHITLTAKSGTMQMIAIVCGILPTFFVSPFAGVWADRYDRKLLIMLSDSMIALTTLAVALLYLSGRGSIALLFVASAIRGIGQGIQSPSVGAFLPQIVPAENLTKVNAANGSIQSAIMLISPMVSGALLTVASIETIFFIDVATAALAVGILLLGLKVPPHARALEKTKTSYFHDLREGFAYIGAHPYVKRFFVFCALFYFAVAPAAFLTPLQVTRSFGSDVWRLTLIEIAFSAGMMSGGILMGVWGGLPNRVHTMALSSFAIGVTIFGLGLVPVFWIYLVLMALTGLTLPLFNTPATVLLQEKVEPEFLGRVFGVLGMISSITMPAGILLFGPLADLVRIEWLLVGTGLVIFVLGFILVGSKTLVAAGRRPEAPQTPDRG